MKTFILKEYNDINTLTFILFFFGLIFIEFQKTKKLCFARL
jgi:cbb3-type cytochrome oxidase subunit 3